MLEHMHLDMDIYVYYRSSRYMIEGLIFREYIRLNREKVPGHEYGVIMHGTC